MRNLYDVNEKLSEQQLEDLYNKFIQQYAPEKLPKLQLFKPEYPFGETTIFLGVPASCLPTLSN